MLVGKKTCALALVMFFILFSVTLSQAEKLRGNSTTNIMNGGYFAQDYLNGMVVFNSNIWASHLAIAPLSLDLRTNMRYLIEPEISGSDRIDNINIIGDRIYFVYNKSEIRVKSIDGTKYQRLYTGKPDYLNVFEDGIYFFEGNNINGSIWYCDLVTGSYKVTDGGKSLNVVDDIMYFHHNGVIYQMSITGQVIAKLATDANLSSHIIVDRDIIGNETNLWVYYRNVDDNNSLYRVNVYTSEKQKVSSEYCRGFAVSNGIVYYSSDTGTYCGSYNQTSKCFEFSEYLAEVSAELICLVVNEPYSRDVSLVMYTDPNEPAGNYKFIQDYASAINR